MGASAALAGLLFVAISINVDRILGFPWLVPRAWMTLTLLLGSLIEASIALWPHQSARVTGLEILLASTIVWVRAIVLTVSAPRAPIEYTGGTLLSISLTQLSSLSALAGSALVAAFGWDIGIYAIAFGILMSMVIAFFNSWVFLIEILR